MDDVDVFAKLCAPVREMSEPLVIGSDEGRNVSSKITPFAPRKPPEKSPGAHQMVHKNVCLIKADVDVMDKPCAPTGGGTCVPIVEYDCGQDVSSSIPSITPRLSPKNSPGGPYTLVKMMLHFMDMAAMELDALRTMVRSRGYYDFEKGGMKSTIFLKREDYVKPDLLPVGGDDEVIELQVCPYCGYDQVYPGKPCPACLAAPAAGNHSYMPSGQSSC